jgi:hypothetical protein
MRRFSSKRPQVQCYELFVAHRRVQPVFEAIVESAAHLTGAIFSVLYLYDGDRMRIGATSNFSTGAIRRIQEMQQLRRPQRSQLAGRAILERAIVHVQDVLADPEYSRTPNHELYRIVPEYRAVLDGGDIKRVMFVDGKDERLSTWKPGHNITFCPDANKMIDTTINSVVTWSLNLTLHANRFLSVTRLTAPCRAHGMTPTTSRPLRGASTIRASWLLRQKDNLAGTMRFAPTTKLA